jgi:hypothetical protein
MQWQAAVVGEFTNEAGKSFKSKTSKISILKKSRRFFLNKNGVLIIPFRI